MATAPPQIHERLCYLNTALLNIPTLFVGTGAATVENSMEVPQKAKNRTTI